MSDVWTTGHSGVNTDGLAHHHALVEGEEDGKDYCQVASILDHSCTIGNW